MYTSSSSVELVSAVRLNWKRLLVDRVNRGVSAFQQEKGYGMKHGIYAFIRTYSCVHIVHVRMVVERVIVALRAQKVAQHVISRVFVAGSTWNTRVF